MVVVVAVVVVVILILIVDVHVSEFRYLVDMMIMIRGKKAISCNLIVDPPQGPRDAAR